MKLPRLQRSRLTDQVAEVLYNKITNGELRPGEKLPSEMELSEQLGVARPTVREALSRLIGLGLVTRSGYNMMVAEAPDLAVRAGLVPLFLEQWEIRELYEARILIECDLVSLAIVKATPENIRELREINAKLRDADLSENSYWTNDMQFHSQIASMSGNAVMIAISEIINDIFKRYQSNVEELHAIQAATYKQHEELIDAIERRDEQAAREIVIRTLSGSEKALYELMRLKESSSGGRGA
jgi:GntR family transcriptional repressor for pyruvate dehydrogenase complex